MFKSVLQILLGINQGCTCWVIEYFFFNFVWNTIQFSQHLYYFIFPLSVYNAFTLQLFILVLGIWVCGCVKGRGQPWVLFCLIFETGSHTDPRTYQLARQGGHSPRDPPVSASSALRLQEGSWLFKAGLCEYKAKLPWLSHLLSPGLFVFCVPPCLRQGPQLFPTVHSRE